MSDSTETLWHTEDPAALANDFERRFGRRPAVIHRAPGRVNLIGEHTDYNDGHVLPLAVPMAVLVAAAPRDDRRLRIASAQEATVAEVSLDDLEPGVVDGWAAYVAGTAWSLLTGGSAWDAVDLVGADVLVNGAVPQGAGLSSSAALECATAGALLQLADVGLEPAAVALAAQRAENDFVGMPCGIMDQFASMCSRAGHLLFLDTRSREIRHVPFDLAASGLALLVTDTRAPHRLVSGEYAARRASCAHAAGLLGVRALRDVIDVDSAISRLTDPTLQRRVRHVVTEQARVLRVVELLDRGSDPRLIGPDLTASHASLRDDYEVTVPELDLAVETALASGAYGSRMTGGGFGGSTISLVDAGAVDSTRAALADAFAAAGFAAPISRVVVPGDGARALQVPTDRRADGEPQ